MLEDRVLIWRIRHGREDGLVRAYEKYKGLLLKVAYGLLNDGSLAEDLVQDVFTAVAEAPSQLKTEGSLKAYLVRSVINRARNVRRSDQVRQRYQGDRASSTGSTQEGPEQWAVISDELRHVHEALAQLPYEQQETITLRLRGGMTSKEIARLQDVSINTVQSRYRYGLERLRALLDHGAKP
jgi:RNA polymerase sigma-70 factor, ECF subfamily